MRASCSSYLKKVAEVFDQHTNKGKLLNPIFFIIREGLNLSIEKI